MKATVRDEVLGEIVYSESPWTGKQSLSLNGQPCDRVAKKQFEYRYQQTQRLPLLIKLKGSFITGLTLYADGREVQVVPKPKWYEFALSLIPFVFIMLFGNIDVLFNILPTVGGAIGGAIGGLGTAGSLLVMRTAKDKRTGILLGLCVSAAAIGICVFIGIMLTVIINAIAEAY